MLIGNSVKVLFTEIVREVTEARADLYAAAGEREAQHETPPDSLTPLELAPEEEDGNFCIYYIHPSKIILLYNIIINYSVFGLPLF